MSRPPNSEHPGKLVQWICVYVADPCCLGGEGFIMEVSSIVGGSVFFFMFSFFFWGVIPPWNVTGLQASWPLGNCLAGPEFLIFHLKQGVPWGVTLHWWKYHRFSLSSYYCIPESDDWDDSRIFFFPDSIWTSPSIPFDSEALEALAGAAKWSGGRRGWAQFWNRSANLIGRLAGG